MGAGLLPWRRQVWAEHQVGPPPPLPRPWLLQLTRHPSASPASSGDGYVQADARGPRDYEDHLYVNTQGLDAPESLPPEDSPKKDLFDMRTWGQAGLREGGGHAPGTCSLPGEAQPPPQELLEVRSLWDSPAFWG